jgi:two-component system sensor histidine kinase CiaH
MLKKMRWRFIGAAMAAFTAVVLTLLCFVNLWNYHSVTSQQDEALTRLMEIEDQQMPFSSRRGALPFDDWSHFSPEVQYSLRFFSVHYDTNGIVSRVNQDYIASISESDAETYADAVLESGKAHGYESGYRYLVSTTEDETVVLFLNSEREIQTMRSLLWITLAIAAVCLAVVFGLVVLFSQRAITPYLKNMEAQKQFITNAGHELKTPLTAISTSADVLAMEHDGDEWVHNIQVQSGRLSKLITSLVALSRLDEENPFPVRTEFSLSDALWEISEPFGSLAQAKGKAYTQDIADGLTVTGDRTAIQQMFSILLDNALKYSPDGGSISLTTQRSGKRAEVTVSNTVDTAQSIDTTRLFDRFYRADESHSGAVSGTGIGLSIVKATVEAHGGTISVRQEGCVMMLTARL